MIKDRHGTAAWEFTLVAFSFFLMLLTIFDIGRYAITQYSLGTLASAEARALVIGCYNAAVIANTSPSVCTSDPMSNEAKQAVAPFLFFGGLTPGYSAVPQGNVLTITVTQPNFTSIMPIWGSLLTAPSASTTVSY